jgi:hypothetical protein
MEVEQPDFPWIFLIFHLFAMGFSKGKGCVTANS